MKRLAITIAAAALATGLSAAQTVDAPYPQPRGDANLSVESFWTGSSRDGLLTRDQVERYGSSRYDGAALDFEAMDIDGNGVASQSEWQTSHRGQAAAGFAPAARR